MTLLNLFRCCSDSDESSPVSAISFDDAGEDILAVAYLNGRVLLYDCSFRTDDRISTIGRIDPAIEVFTKADVSSAVVHLAWKPYELVLAMGRNDGQISLWSVYRCYDKSLNLSTSVMSPLSAKVQVKCLNTNIVVHKVAVVCLEWEKDGSRLVSGDKAGQATLWGTDNTLKVEKFFTKSSPVTCGHWGFLNDENENCVSLYSFGFQSGLFCIVIAGKEDNCIEIQASQSAIEKIVFYNEKRHVIIFTQNFEMMQYRMMKDGSISLESKGDLGLLRPQQSICFAWIPYKGFVVCASNEEFLRFWDLSDDKTGILPLPSVTNSPFQIRASTVTYNDTNENLISASINGTIMMWTPSAITDVSSPLQWDLCYAEHITELNEKRLLSITQSTNELTAVICNDGAYLLKEAKMKFMYNEGTASIQSNEESIFVDHSGSDQLMHVCSHMVMKGLVCDARHLITWGESKIQAYRIFDLRIELISELELQASCVSLVKDNLYIANQKNVLVMSITGMHRLTIYFSQCEGIPMLMSVTMDILVVVTTLGTVKIFNVSNLEPRLLYPPKNLNDFIAENEFIGQITSVQCNATGALISIVTMKYGRTKFYVLNFPRGELKLVPHDNACSAISHLWDPAETRLLACEFGYNARHFQKSPVELSQLKRIGRCHQANFPPRVMLFFVDEVGGSIYLHEMISPPPLSILIGIDVPHIVFVQREKVINQVMKSFIGLEEESPFTLAAMIDFYFYLSMNDIEKSLESLQAVRSTRAWASVTPIFLQLKKLDETEMCLSRMKHHKGVEALRRAKSEPEIEAILAAAAIELGHYDIAKALYTECKRYDLLNLLFQNLGQWEFAIQIAESHDRLHLDLTQYRYAKYLEEKGDYDTVLDRFEFYVKKSSILSKFIQDNQLDVLEAQIIQKNNKELFQWFGDFNKSKGDIAKALDFYLLAGDDFKLVELHCSTGNFDKAFSVVEESGNVAAACHLAKFIDGPEAVRLYCMGGMFNHAIRVAMTNESSDSDLIQIVKKCRPSQVFECAKYFERKGMLENASALYMLCGQYSKSLGICLEVLGRNTKEGENKEMVELLVASVNKFNGSFPIEVSQIVIDQLHRLGEIDSMVKVISSSIKDTKACIEACFDRKIILTEAIIEKLLSVDMTEREEKLRLVAIKCEQQRNYDLACSMYTKLGDKNQGMKSLLKGGNTKVIMAYAIESKCEDIYVMAANYLQKLDLSTNSEIEQSIIALYSKAGKHDKVVSYYISQSKWYVEQWGNYEKALDYLKEALSTVASGKMNRNHGDNSDGKNEILRLVKIRISIMERFLSAKKTLLSIDRLSIETLCRDLLSPHANGIIREGDCYSLLVNYFVSLGDYPAAYKQIQLMREHCSSLTQFIPSALVDKILRSAETHNCQFKDENKEKN